MVRKIWCPAHLITVQVDNQTNREAILSCDGNVTST
jgi:hypothetical protein